MSSKAARALASAEEMAAEEGGHKPGKTPAARPRDAATLIIIDQSGAEPKVLMGRRSPRQKFMPNQFVFPGGRADAGDGLIAAASELSPAVEARLFKLAQRPSARKARGLALAAIRETFEETGVLIGVKSAASSSLPDQGPWAEFKRRGLAPDLGRLHFLARAITPPMRPKRFDTRFFVIEGSAIAGTVEGIAGPDAEMVEIAWVSLAETLKMDLPRITRVIVEDLELALNEGLKPSRAAPFYFMRRGKFALEKI